MPLKISSFKKEILKQDFRNVGWISIVYFLGLFFALPLQLFMALSDERRAYYGITFDRGLFDQTFLFDIQVLFLFILPVLMAIFLFRYLHVKTTSDFIHSLPIKREKLFNHHASSGLLMLLLPVLVNSIIMALLLGIDGASEFYVFSDVAYWAAVMLVLTVFVFLAAVVVGTLTGLSTLQGVLTYILLFFPTGIMFLGSYHIGMFVNGFTEGVVYEDGIQNFSPILDLTSYYPPEEKFMPISYVEMGIYIILAVSFYVLAKIIYKKRSLEAASSAIAVASLRPVFIAGMTVCFSVFGGIYFGESQSSINWSFVGYVLGLLFGYCVAVMVTKKTWRVFNLSLLKGLGVYGGVTILFIIVLPLLWKGYESNIPQMDEVESVFLGNSYHHYQDRIDQSNGDLVIESKEGIQSVINLHEAIIEQDSSFDEGDRRYFVAYEMKNGDTIFRSYEIDKEVFAPELKTISETKEYKEIHYPIVQVDPSTVMKLEFNSSHNKGNILNSPEKIKEFLNRLKSDIFALTYEDMIGPTGIPGAEVFVHSGNNNPPHVTILPSFDETTQWLKEEDLYNEVMVQPEDIERMEVIPWTTFENNDSESAFHHAKASGKSGLTIKDKEKIEEAMKAKNYQEDGDYLVAFYFGESGRGDFEVLSFKKDEAPEFIKNHFNN
ncbi:DUF6449 domain-containing protein [Halobacillus yeomjeoni]|uniref:DUF6449 domain-containing protein n=1 Tax=Halobacillus yeomjeoni TaxID=311194 RepID=A0A931HYC5_9BACI|nr:DUF6449 domain-containing protein [Halobacillus yeomjeoni]MBH0231684.1 hypothetical protein [Halobacillus yeomjeoni]